MLLWGQNEQAPVRSVEELDQLLDRLTHDASDPLVAVLEPPGEAALSIGLGSDRSLLNFISSPDPPYFTSQGLEKSDESIEFFYCGELTEYPRRALIPVEDAREAMRRFFKTGERPDNVGWQMD